MTGRMGLDRDWSYTLDGVHLEGRLVALSEGISMESVRSG